MTTRIANGRAAGHAADPGTRTTPTLFTPILAALLFIAIAATAPALAQERIRISSDWGAVAAELVDNEATRALKRMLPLSLAMRDHLRQEKTGALPEPLPAAARQTEFATGTLGLWSSRDFVIYYSGGRVPSPGIVILGRVTGDVAVFDRPGPVSVRIEALP